MASRSRRGRTEGGGSRSRTRREEREGQEDDSSGGGVVEHLTEDTQQLVLYSAPRARRSEGIVFLLAHGLTLAIVLINVSVIYFTLWIGLSPCISFTPLFERIALAYDSLSRGRIKYECAYGGSTIQHLECELKIGLNRVFFQLIAQALEFIYMIFSPKNLFTLTSSVYALAKLTAELMRTTLPVVSKILLTTLDSFKSYYTLIHCHSEIAVHRLLNE